jgi:hypothetical protein
MKSVSFIVNRDIYSSTMQTESIVAFPWSQWLRERATVLRYAYIACIVLQVNCETRTSDVSELHAVREPLGENPCQMRSSHLHNVQATDVKDRVTP